MVFHYGSHRNVSIRERKLNFSSFTFKHTCIQFFFLPRKSTHNNSLPANNCYLFFSFLFIEYTIVLFTPAFAEIFIRIQSQCFHRNPINSNWSNSEVKLFWGFFFPLSLFLSLFRYLIIQRLPPTSTSTSSSKHPSHSPIHSHIYFIFYCNVHFLLQ